MSRTYRKYPQYYYKLHGQFYYDCDAKGTRKEYWAWFWKHLYPYHPDHREDYDVKDSRDKKPRHKPSKVFKKIQSQGDRAAVKNAIRTGKELMPFRKKTDVWDWN